MARFQSGGGEPPHEERRARDRRDPEERRYLDGLFALARVNGVLDEVTGDHVMRIRFVVERTALRLGTSASEAAAIGQAAVLHDIGKIKIPPAILRKPAALTDAERAIMQLHTERGARLLAGKPRLERAARIAMSHHEAWDGSGYPQGLRGEAIPLEARITAAADMLDALVSPRSYKSGWLLADAMAEIVRLSGTRFDPDVVTALGATYHDGELNAVYRCPPSGRSAA